MNSSQKKQTYNRIIEGRIWRTQKRFPKMRTQQSRLRALFAFVALVMSFSITFKARSDSSTPPPTWSPEKPNLKVATLLYTWHDTARNRDVPVKIYYPVAATKPCPMIIFSHGLGGNREGYSYLGEAWAGVGFISVHVQHLGSDDGVWRGAGLEALADLKRSAMDPANAINRAEDIPFAIDQMLKLNDAKGPLHGLIDKSEIGMAGHSFGAWTTLALVGEKTPTGQSFTDARIKSGIAMSAPVPGGRAIAAAFSDIKVPIFHMTGTLDDSPVGETVAADRRIPYDQSTTPGSCLVTFNGADHMVFSGRMFGQINHDDARYQSLIVPATIAFWDDTLRGNKDAANWLYHGGFTGILGNQGTFETR
jgi:predicted dienelactone hydrolase